jgi:hypothetical protein
MPFALNDRRSVKVIIPIAKRIFEDQNKLSSIGFGIINDAPIILFRRSSFIITARQIISRG